MSTLRWAIACLVCLAIWVGSVGGGNPDTGEPPDAVHLLGKPLENLADVTFGNAVRVGRFLFEGVPADQDSSSAPEQPAEPDNYYVQVAVPEPELPADVQEFLAMRGLRFDDTVAANACLRDVPAAFSVESGTHPFAVRGDFNGDGRADYAVTAANPRGIGETWILMAGATPRELPGAEVLALRAAGSDVFGRRLAFDAPETVYCEKSSQLYVYDPARDDFELIITSD